MTPGPTVCPIISALVFVPSGSPRRRLWSRWAEPGPEQEAAAVELSTSQDLSAVCSGQSDAGNELEPASVGVGHEQSSFVDEPTAVDENEIIVSETRRHIKERS